jgi:nucleoside-diphosphate-sugar epimerase
METTRRSDRRALVTGAGGFLGQPAVKALLERGWPVEAATLGPPPVGAGEARWHDIDLLDSGLVSRLLEETRPSHLLHLAWHIGAAGDLYDSRENDRWVESSVALLREFADLGGKRVVFVGSCAEYDWEHGVCDERTTPLSPASRYGLAKKELGERFTQVLAADDRLTGAWARPFFLFGPHEAPRRLLASVIRSLLEGEPARCSHGRQIRDYLYSVDAADALVTLLESDVEGAVNIASGEPSTIAQLVYRAAAQLGREELVELGAIAARPDEPPLIVADVRRLREEVGWSPRHAIEEALGATIDWWRRRIDGE